MFNAGGSWINCLFIGSPFSSIPRAKKVPLLDSLSLSLSASSWLGLNVVALGLIKNGTALCSACAAYPVVLLLSHLQILISLSLLQDAIPTCVRVANLTRLQERS